MNTKAAIQAIILFVIGLSGGYLLGNRSSSPLPPPASPLQSAADVPVQLDRSERPYPLDSTPKTEPPSPDSVNIPAIAVARPWKSRAELEQIDTHTHELLVRYEATFPGLWNFKNNDQLAWLVQQGIPAPEELMDAERQGLDTVLEQFSNEPSVSMKRRLAAVAAFKAIKDAHLYPALDDAKREYDEQLNRHKGLALAQIEVLKSGPLVRGYFRLAESTLLHANSNQRFSAISTIMLAGDLRIGPPARVLASELKSMFPKLGEQEIRRLSEEISGPIMEMRNFSTQSPQCAGFMP